MKHAPKTGYVSHEPEDQMVFVRLENGKIDLSVYLSNEIDTSDEIITAIDAWSNDSSPVIIAPHFSIASPIDYMIDMNQMPAHGNMVDIESKPTFDAIRAEMQYQINRIDAIVFKAA